MSEIAHDVTRKARWYFGGVASAAASFITHPLDLLRVNLQTHQRKLSVLYFTMGIIKQHGILALYSGFTASIFRQMTYSMTRFGMYEVGKNYINSDTFVGKITLAGAAGTIGGLVGTPADMVILRMQNDIKMKPKPYWNYKSIPDGLTRICKEETLRRLYSGALLSVTRGLVVNIGQIAIYEQVKGILIDGHHFSDEMFTYLTASLIAAITSTTLAQPVDVVKTRWMCSRPGRFASLKDVIMYTAQLGPRGFYKGIIPTSLRLTPHTILTFVFLEELRLHFGSLNNNYS